MSLQADPYALRYAASRFSAGAGELRRNASLVLVHKSQLVSHDWKGIASQAFDVQSEHQGSYLRQTADILEQAASVLNSLASQVERVMELQRQAEQYERASWEYDGDTLDDLHHRQNLARQAAYYRQQAEWEARQADTMASGQLNQIMAMIPNVMNRGSLGTGGSDDFDDLPEPMRSYYKRHPELREAGMTSTSKETDVSLTPDQRRRAYKEEAIQHEIEEEQKHVSLEDLLALYYITKRDFNQFVSPENMIEQNLKLDGITTEEQLREHVAMQIKINQENDEMVRFCSQPENYDHPNCVVFKYNQAGGMEPVSIGLASMATAKVLSMGAKKALSLITEKVFSNSGEFVRVALPGGGSIKVGVIQASGEHSEGTSKPKAVLPSQGNVIGSYPDAPVIDAGKQGKHVPGHPNNIPDKSQWPAGVDGIELTQEAWMKGRNARADGSVRIFDFGRPVGPNGETRVKVHMDSKGRIHGYPVK